MTAARDVMGAGEGGKEKPAVVSSGLKDDEAVQGGSGMHAGVSMQGIGVEVKQSGVSAALGVGADEGGRTLEWVDGLPPWTDAGMSEEWQKAKRETEKATLRLQERRASAEELIAQARAEEPDLVKRAKRLQALGAFEYPDTRAIQSGGEIRFQASNTAANRFAFFDALFGKEPPGRPFYDLAQRLPVDHNGNEIDDSYDIVTLIRAMDAAQLKGQSADLVYKDLTWWVNNCKVNSIQHRFEPKVPAWDGRERLETMLVELLQCARTKLNYEFAKYFWLSLYNRITSPGCLAPMVLTLFGAQGAGKSRLAQEICQLVLGKKVGDSEQFHIDSDHVRFLRNVTGKTVIASVGEMSGFAKADMRKVKDFVTRRMDRIDHKFKQAKEVHRQWIFMMDGNKYEDLQRDDTGNRRFYPMFVGQEVDEEGQPRYDYEGKVLWSDTFKVDYTGFSENFWQVMAECRAWMKEHGMRGYEAFVRSVEVQVMSFNANERSSGRGTVRDPVLDEFLIPAIAWCHENGKVKYRSRGKFGTGNYIKSSDLTKALATISPEKEPNVDRLKLKMEALGAPFTNDKGGFDGGYGAYFWKDKPRGYYLSLISSGEDFGDEDAGGF
ncbi:hypothetical protein FX016_21765 [Cupriavidus gilardii]|nr:hypothetical protein FX016_21765 [Cupriavidus gilardii]